MAQFILKIDIGNDAMKTPRDICRTLREIADNITDTRINDLRHFQSVRDVNGNRIGQFGIKGNVGETLPIVEVD